MQLSHIRPLGVGEILDGAFALYRRHFGEFFTASLLPQLPVVGLWLVFMAVATVVRDLETQMILFAVFGLLSLPLQLIAAVVPMGAATRLAADAYLGNPLSGREAMRHAWSRFLSLWGALMIVGLATVVGALLLIVPGVFAWLAFFAAVPVVMIEGRGGLDAAPRSLELARGAWGKLFLVMLVVLIIVMLPTMGVLAVSLGVAATVAETATAGPVFEAATRALQALVAALATPLSMIATTLLYYDRRIRAEGFGLEAGLEAAPGVLEPA